MEFHNNELSLIRGCGGGQILKWDNTNYEWDCADDAGSGGVNWWTEGSGALYEINTTLDVLIGSNATSSAEFAFINLAGGTPTLDLADGVLLDLSTINHGTNAVEGLLLPQNTALTAPSSGEGYLAWESDVNMLKVSDGSNFVHVAYDRAKYDRIVDANGGGTDTTIQGAIDNSSAGDSIFISPGTYAEDVAIDQELKLFGAGAGATIIAAASTGQAAVTINAGIDNVEIHNLEITNSYSASTDHGIEVVSGSSNDDVILNNLEISGGYHGILFDYGARAKITNNYVHDTAQSGIYNTGNQVMTYAEVSGNKVQNTTTSGIDIGTGGHYARVVNNLVSNWGNTNYLDRGIHVRGDNSIVQNNFLHGQASSYRGIFVEHSENCAISNNVVTGITENALDIDSVDYTTVSSNTTEGGTRGILINTSTYNTISGNTFSGASTAAIDFLDNTSTNNTVTSNTLYNNTGNIVNNSGTGNRVFANNTDATGSLAEEFSILDTAADTLFAFSNPDSTYITDIGIAGGLSVGNASAPVGLLDVDSSSLATFGKALAIFDHYENQNIITASASGTTVFNLTRDGDLEADGDLDVGGGDITNSTTNGSLTLTPDGTGDVVVSADTDTDFILDSTVSNADSFVLSPYNAGSNFYTGTLTTADLTADRTWILPNLGGTVALTSQLYWQLNSEVLSPVVSSYDLAIGGTATSSAHFQVFGIENASGNIMQISSDTITTGTIFDLSSTALTDGTALDISVTSTNFDAGSIASFDFSPTSWATASGDLVKIELGQYGDVTGNLFAIYDNGSDVFRASTTQIESAVPHVFSSAGDVSFSYDAVFTNQTSSKIETYAPFTIQVGESFESNDLTLQTYNSGDIVIDNVDNGIIATFKGATGKVGFGDTSPEGLLDVDGAAIGQALVQLNESGNQNIITASASGTTVLNLTIDGDIEVDGVFSFGDTTPDENAYNTIGTGDQGSGQVADGNDLFITLIPLQI